MFAKPPIVKQAALLLTLFLLTALSDGALAQTKPKRTEVGGEAPQSIMWVGNSFFYYNNSMHNYLINLLKAADPKSRARGVSVTISGSGIDWHDMESYFRPNGIGKYSFVGDNEIVFNKPGKPAPWTGYWKVKDTLNTTSLGYTYA